MNDPWTVPLTWLREPMAPCSAVTEALREHGPAVPPLPETLSSTERAGTAALLQFALSN